MDKQLEVGAAGIKIIEICTPCLVCGEDVPVYSSFDPPKICPGCRAAVMAVRRRLEGDHDTE